MKHLQPLEAWMLLAFALFLFACVVNCQAKDAPMPIKNEAVEKSIAASRLRSLAASTTDPEVCLGLALFPQPGDPIRRELLKTALKAGSNYAATAVLITNAMDGVDEQSARELTRLDPNNALGYYLLAGRLYGPGKERQMLDAFRNGAACPELRLYGGSISNILFKALNALGLSPRERLCAASWMATRWDNFEILNCQAQATLLKGLAKGASTETRQEISDCLLKLAGQLMASDLQRSATFGKRALQDAFRLKAEIAASEKSPMMNAYAGVVQALVSTRLYFPGLETQDSSELALHLPGSIWYAFVAIHPDQAWDYFPELKNLNRADPAFADAYNNWSKAAAALIETALPDTDELIGAYFSGHKPLPPNAPGPWATSLTYVESVTYRRPALLKAAQAYNSARAAFVNQNESLSKLSETPSGDPATAAKIKCIENLRRIDSAKQQWALEFGRQAQDVPSLEDLKNYLTLPRCPSGGTYSIGPVFEKPACTIPGHALP